MTYQLVDSHINNVFIIQTNLFFFIPESPFHPSVHMYTQIRLIV